MARTTKELVAQKGEAEIPVDREIISGEGVWGFVLAPVGSNGGVVWHELVVEPTMHNAATRAV